MSVGALPETRTQVFRVLPYVLCIAVLLAHLALLAPSIFVQRLWEDEAFNLTVPLNLLAGLGYTSDGTLSGSELTPFDVRISTGPVVLLPAAFVMALGVDPVIGGRLVAAGFWMLLVIGLAVLGRRIAGVWGATVAAVVPLTLHTFQGYSPIQGPADFLGEGAAAALIVWAMVLLRRRPWLAGLFAGLAIQAKFIALLALPALAVGLLVLTGVGTRRWVAVLWKPAVLALAPTALYELVALVSLGVRGFIVHAKQFVYFLLSSGQTVEPTSFGERMHALMGSWYLPAVLVWGVTAVGAVLVGVALVRSRNMWKAADQRAIVAIAVVPLVGLATYMLWWGTASHTPIWIRHPAPALLAFVPILAAYVVRGLRELGGWGVRAGESLLLRRSLAGVLGSGLGVLILAQTGAHLAQDYAPEQETLATQRNHAVTIAEGATQFANVDLALSSRDGASWLAADPWGSAVNIVFLTGAHIGLSDAPNVADALRVSVGECVAGDPLASTGPYSLCEGP